MIGKLAYRLKSTFRYGVRVAYYRDVIRPRILESGSIATGAPGSGDVHVLTSADDFLNCLWSLASFFRQSGPVVGLCVHDDGSLEQYHIDKIKNLFPAARVITRQEADDRMVSILAEYPRCLAFRRSHNLALKLLDFQEFMAGERYMLLDSDILFFSKPDELVRRVVDESNLLNSFNRGEKSAYTIEPELLDERLRVRVPRRLNSGLGVVQKQSIPYARIEDFLAFDGIHSHSWRVEQTLFAMCSAVYGVDLLPEEYDVYFGPKRTGTPSRHYVGPIRHLMYGEGVRRLFKDGFLSQKRGARA